MDAIISVREPPAKRWKGSHVGAVWGWEPYSETATRRSSLMKASSEPMPHEIGQSHCSPATGGSQTTKETSHAPGSKYPKRAGGPNTPILGLKQPKIDPILVRRGENAGRNGGFRAPVPNLL